MVWAWMPLAWLRKHVGGLGSLKKPGLLSAPYPYIHIYIYIYSMSQRLHKNGTRSHKFQADQVPLDFCSDG